MIGYLLRRLLASALMLLLVLTATFALSHLAPGDPTDRFTNPRIPRAQSERLAALYGLDRPWPLQYLSWLRAVTLEGDLGISFLHLRPVRAVVGEFLGHSLILVAGALCVQYGLGLILGIAAARWPGSLVDHLIRVGSLVLYSIPAFWLGLMMVLVFSHTLHLLPAGNMRSLGAAELSAWGRFVDLLRHLILPAFVLGAPLAAELGRFVRNGLLEVLDQDYIRSARARGLSELRVLWRHALRNAVVPVTQLAGLSVPYLVGGAFAVEWVFSWPGIGFLTLQAIDANDYPLILATTALTATLVVLGNLGADLLHGLADPRIRDAEGPA